MVFISVSLYSSNRDSSRFFIVGTGFNDLPTSLVHNNVGLYAKMMRNRINYRFGFFTGKGYGGFVMYNHTGLEIGVEFNIVSGNKVRLFGGLDGIIRYTRNYTQENYKYNNRIAFGPLFGVEYLLYKKIYLCHEISINYGPEFHTYYVPLTKPFFEIGRGLSIQFLYKLD
ncbi:hypothetical protein JYU23_00590 [bacterium AH-315-C07]|nr:hypothetical protein [bacterium AH-315-C07]